MNNAERIRQRSFLSAIGVILVLMALSFVLARSLPGCSLGWGAFLASPVLVLGMEGGGTVVAVIIFLMLIGGIFASLEEGRLLEALLDTLVGALGSRRYRLLLAITFCFMAMGAFVGCFEECVPLVPVVVALTVRLGWDGLTGLGASMLAMGCGFASGVFNPFTVGVAQELAGLPTFSGLWLRLVSFVVIFAALWPFLYFHAKKVERNVSSSGAQADAVGPEKRRALKLFAAILGGGFCLVLLSVLVPALQDFTLIFVALAFLGAGFTATAVSGMGARRLWRSFARGMVSTLPAAAMILLASSIRYILSASGALDYLLECALELTRGAGAAAVVLVLYAIVLVGNFFIPSGSAKAGLLIPVLLPLCSACGVPAQLLVLAFAFGDGFSNTLYPTNPVLLISLGLTGTGYGTWLRWAGKFQLLVLALTCGILLLGLAVGYC